MIYYSKIILKNKNKRSFPPFIFIHSAEVEEDAVPRIHNEINFSFPSSSCYSNWTTGKGKKEKLFFFFWRFWPWCTRENARVVDRPTRNPPIDPSHCTTPFWFICPGLNVLQKQSDHGIPPPRNSFLSLNYYITSLSLMKFNQTRFWTNTFFFDSTSEKEKKMAHNIFTAFWTLNSRAQYP